MTTWSAAQIPDQSGRTALVTGANSGIGLVTARELARAGARVVMACRDEGRGEGALERVRTAVPGAQLELAQLDLADLASVRAFAAAWDGHGRPLDLLVDNAGVMALPRRTSPDGFELQLATNHLGHFALCGLLLSHLLAAPDPRVVTVSSLAHRMARISFEDLQGERRYSRWGAYGQSKLANLLFAYELQRRADAAGAALRSVAAHPGYTATNLQLAGARMKGSRLEEKLVGLINRTVGQDDEHGALPTLYAATTAELPGGSFVGPDGPLELRGGPRLVGSTSRSHDAVRARRLWEVSEDLTSVRYAFVPTAAAA
jgi:NAD(P)-dependent dehydrogenase (short-subunit alcohol dehydrogenase family)